MKYDRWMEYLSESYRRTACLWIKIESNGGSIVDLYENAPSGVIDFYHQLKGDSEVGLEP